MNPFSKYKSKSFIRFIILVTLIPSLFTGITKGVEESSLLKGFENFFFSILAILCMLLICRIPFLIIDYRKWLRVHNNPDYLLDVVEQKGSIKAFNKLKKLAQEGNLDAAYCLAYAYSWDCESAFYNADEGFYWATYAAERGQRYAQLYLGVLYADGVCAEIDYKKAAYWFEQAAENNLYLSSLNLYNLYNEGGHGIEQDLHKAFLHLKNYAQKSDDIVGKYLVGEYLFDGIGVKENKEEAFKWFKEVVNTAEAEILYDFENDMSIISVPILPKEAIVKAYYFMSVCFQNGYGTPADEKIAEYWNQKYEMALKEQEEYDGLDENARKKFIKNKMNKYKYESN